ncbi:succinylglutamate desuccinylase/aspartoacylase family protein [Desulfopila sp. IMCC35008]|uniref:succinylglutamate desuccinylase/aspartoacylase family protein n=1 Tax=Desulfopila sp. IMCC35008 TaxID=2653858 RepID=UPI0013D041F8|nr:succinylglutamate desuccinylase/aspartoacylase family protein [Desulfopila sp. IMCC35008]
MKTIETITLPAASPGTNRALTVIRYTSQGSTPGPKVYIQAGLHADEAPGYLVAHHLTTLLDQAEVKGEIVLVPAANPIGLSQWRDELLHGRFNFANSVNFNRSHLDLVEAVSRKVEGKLTDNPQENVTLIRSAFRECVAETSPIDEAESLKKLLLSMACDADIMLDLHCDHQALVHIYMGTPLWPAAQDLSAQMGADVTLLAENSGGNPFDEACSRIWWDLAAQFPDKPIPPACLSVTIELRGIADTDPEMVSNDARNIFNFLQRRGIVSGTAPELPPLKNKATPLTGVDYVKAPSPGIVSFIKQPGEWLRKGDIIAEIVTPLPAEGEETVVALRTQTDGLMFTRSFDRFARPGKILAKVAGKQPLRDDDENLLTL